MSAKREMTLDEFLERELPESHLARQQLGELRAKLKVAEQERLDWYRAASGLSADLTAIGEQRDALAALISEMQELANDDPGFCEHLGCDLVEALTATDTTSLARRDAEQFRQGFWWGFERARCRPDQMNIRAEYEDVLELRRRQAEQADTAGEVSR